MKIQIASDLHLEHLARRWPGQRFLTPAAGADVLVLAGDIGSVMGAIQAFRNWPVPVLYVAGNHEFYGYTMQDAIAEMREAARGTNVHFLDNDEMILGGVRFLGTTLWTDYELYGPNLRLAAMRTAEQRLWDHQEIRCKGGRFTAEEALSVHQAPAPGSQALWIASTRARPW